MTESEKLIELYNRLEDAGLMVTAGKKDAAELMVAHGVVIPVRCQNCNWWHRYKSGDTSRGVCDKYAMSKSENGYCDEPLLEERKYPWKK